LQQTLVELSERHQIDPNQLTEWKKQLLEHASDIFSKGRKPGQGPRVEDLHARRGQLSIENDYISGAVGRIGDASAKRRSTKEDKLPVTRQCDLLDLCRSGVYCTPAPLRVKDCELQYPQFRSQPEHQEVRQRPARSRCCWMRVGYPIGRNVLPDQSHSGVLLHIKAWRMPDAAILDNALS
jgi:transposase